MINHLGYTLQTNLLSAPKANDYISLADMKPQGDSFDMFSSQFDIHKGYTNGWSWERRYLPFTINNDGSGTITRVGNATDEIVDINNNIIVRYNKYTSNINGRIKINTIISGNKGNAAGSEYYEPVYTCQHNGNTLQNYAPLWSVLNYYYVNEIEVDVSIGDVITFTSYIKNTRGFLAPLDYINWNLDVVVDYISGQKVPLYGKLYLNNNTGFDNIFDLFKAYMQTYALTCYVDNANKVIYANTFDKLYTNKATAKDWSNKLVVTNENLLSFMLDNYAQNNEIVFKEKDEYQEKGTFAIANTAIRDNTKELFTIAWESGQDVFINNQELAYIPVYKYSSLTEKEYDGTNPHLVSVTPVGPTNWFANHIKAQILIDTYYTKLKDNMLVSAKMLEVYLLLDEKDIEEFDPFTPVYISYFGAYFYVNKINNFVTKQITKVELIKL